MIKNLKKMDKIILMISILMLGFGALMILSASSLKSYTTYGSNYHYFFKQVIIIFASLFAGFVIIKIPLKFYKKFIGFFLLCIIGALLYLIFEGESVNNTKRFFSILGFGLQPSEFAKLIMILFLAFSYQKLYKSSAREVPITKILFPLLIVIGICILVILQPDLGTAAIIGLIAGGIFFVLPISNKFKVSMILIVVGLMTIGFLAMKVASPSFGLTSTQRNRFNYKKPCSRYESPTGYQVCNGYIAINSGGIFGTGLGNSKQKNLYLPEAHTDFILPIIAEELGLVTIGIILFIYFVLLVRIVKIAQKTYSLLGIIICYGTALMIFLHITINLVGVLGLTPSTGVPLPFLSYGGSFTLTLMASLAFVQRVQIENKIFQQKHLL